MNKDIDQAVYERYIDAATALFMELYSSEMGESIRKEMENDYNEAYSFPKELDDRCRELIKKECSSRQRKHHMRGFVKGLRYAASFAVILLAVASILFVSVDAVRIPIIDYYVERSNGYWIFSESSTADNSQNDLRESTFDYSDPLAGLLPEEYQLVVSDGDSIFNFVAIYDNATGSEVFFSAESSGSSIQIDSEGAQISQTYQLAGKDVVLVVEDTNIRLAWIDEGLSTTFTLIAANMDSESLLNIAEQLIKNIS